MLDRQVKNSLRADICRHLDGIVTAPTAYSLYSKISENLGKTPATAYNATHGYSDQYILELKIFRTLAESVGLQLNQDASCRFPESDLATVSINYFEGKI